MARNYVSWYRLKAKIENIDEVRLFQEREIWWCSLGANIGAEEDGKNELFERPVLVVRKFSKELFIGLPLSTKLKDNRYYHPIKIGEQEGSVLVSQLRVLSSKRLTRKLEKIGKGLFGEIVDKVAGVVFPLKSISADFSAESPVPSGNLYPHYTKRKRNSQDHVALKTSNELK